MTQHPDLDRRLTRFLAEEAPRRVPERLISATREHVATTRQRRLTFRFGQRLAAVVLTPAGGIAAGLAVVVFVSALVVSGGSGPGVGSAASPAASAASTTRPSAPSSPSPSVCPTDAQPCVPELGAGQHSSARFVPALRYTVPAGWINTLDDRGELDLRYAAGGQYTYPDGLTFHDGISIFRRPVAESAASRVPLDGIGTTAMDLADWLAGHADLVASTPRPITIGRAAGYRMTLSLPNGSRASPDHCTRDHGEPRCESLFLSGDPSATYGFGLVGPEVADVYLLDLDGGDTVMVVIDDTDGVDQPGLEAAARPVVESFSFSP